MTQGEHTKILVALDFSPFSEDVARRAVDLAACAGAELVALNVIHQRDLDALGFIEATTQMVHRDEYRRAQEERRLAQLQELLAGAAISLTYSVRTGVPWEEILAAAEEHQVDMIVMGTKGRSNLERSLFGSQADKVYRQSPRTVVSVRGGRHREVMDRLRPRQA